MRVPVLRLALAFAALGALAGCGLSLFDEPRAAWRHDVEARCIASGRVKETEFVKAVAEVDGPGSCGADKPFQVYAALSGTVWLSEPVLMNCPMTAAVDDWLNEVVQPTAMAVYGMPIRELKTSGTYSCRRVYGRTVGSMSEHAYLNAIDVTGFQLEDGRQISVKSDWRSADADKRRFLATIGGRSCDIFTTVLGPDYDSAHNNHFHLDLAFRAAATKPFCRGWSGAPMSYAPAARATSGGAAGAAGSHLGLGLD